MDIIVSPKTGLPIDFGKIKSKGTMLKPLPFQFLLREFQKKFWQLQASKFDGEINLKDIDAIFKQLGNVNLKFGYWSYHLISYNPYDGLSLQVRAIRNDMMAQMVIVEDIFEDIPCYSTYLNYSGCFEDYENQFEICLLEGNDNILKWNSICTMKKPIIYKAPPIEKFKEELLDEFWDHAVMEEFQHFRFDYCDCLEAFLDNHIFLPLSLERSTQDFECRFGPFTLRIHYIILDHLMIMQVLLEFENLNNYLILTEKELELFDDCFLLEDLESIFETILHEALDAIIQWNKILTEEEGCNEQHNRKANRITG